MNTPSLPGTDRAQAADAARRTPSRRSNGDERFGAALSAELDGRTTRDDHVPDSRNQDRGTRGTSGQPSAAPDRVVQNHAARDRPAHAGRHRAEDRAAHDRSVGTPKADGVESERTRPVRRRPAGDDQAMSDSATGQAGAAAGITPAGAPAATGAGSSPSGTGAETTGLPHVGSASGAGASAQGTPAAATVGSATTKEAADPTTAGAAPLVDHADTPLEADKTPSLAHDRGNGTAHDSTAGNSATGNEAAGKTTTGNTTTGNTGGTAGSAAAGSEPGNGAAARGAGGAAAATGPAANGPAGSGPPPTQAATAGGTGTGQTEGSTQAAAPDQPSGAVAATGADQNTPSTTQAQDQPTNPTAPSTTATSSAAVTPDTTASGPAQHTAEPPQARDAAPGVPENALAGVTGAASTAPTTTAAAPSSAPAPSAAPPAPQIAMRIVPLRLEADGVHRLTVNLHPADLGPVQVVAEIRNGDVSLQLSGSTDAGTAALRDSLNDLRRELTDAGFGNCDLDLRQGGGDARPEQPRQQFGPSRPNLTTPSPIATPAAAPEKGRLDVRA